MTLRNRGEGPMALCFYKFLTVCVVLSICVQSVGVGHLVIMPQGQSPGERGASFVPLLDDCGTLRMTPAQPESVWRVGCRCPAELPGCFFFSFLGVLSQVGSCKHTGTLLTLDT
ncbi:hypothetical protein BO70DRAFT_135315 [Aspergillus heteromorphus CBS 117.55]|uniref:Uncharacterized protein n=1 Tax=Aspergillus heteromorphus CBS 117.55 TaxID=1448321 RepID=A0A317WUX7_9EURO|nr:uncharacterized protein BO70DRAFT_135315 [Aspergillus heteromorphus CBS 117.55]PWY90159.1 hypothetical protein BO70DRAFT_135315 [Aspergillus heteromorphus CBS 117.55]